MSRLILMHWNAHEAQERAERLRRAGHDVEVMAVPDIARLRGLRARPPEAVVIDLSRVPSHGRAMAIWLRRQKGTRAAPIVFVGGDPEKVEGTRARLPDATYAEWPRIRSAIREAIRHAPLRPVVPGTMDEYAGRPLPKKLGIRAGIALALLGAPGGFATALGGLPERVRLRTRLGGVADLALLFVVTRADLRRRLPAAQKMMAERGVLWVVWPKKASGHASDLGQIEVRKAGLDSGWVDYKVCAVDETWSGLAFVRRRRPPARKEGGR